MGPVWDVRRRRLVHGTSVRLNAPYELEKGDTWWVMKQMPDDSAPGAVVLKPAANA